MPVATLQEIANFEMTPQRVSAAISVYDIFQLYLQHGYAHIEQIEHIKQAQGIA